MAKFIINFIGYRLVSGKKLSLIAFSVVLVFAAAIPLGHVSAKSECKDNNGTLKWSGTDHGDNSPSTHKAKQMINSGASLCQLAKACDHMQIDVKIDSKTELHNMVFYQQANAEQQKELDHSIKHGVGHDNPNLVCYELEYAASESNG